MEFFFYIAEVIDEYYTVIVLPKILKEDETVEGHYFLFDWKWPILINFPYNIELNSLICLTGETFFQGKFKLKDGKIYINNRKKADILLISSVTYANFVTVTL